MVCFCPFTPLTILKSKFWRNEKNAWRYHHLHLCIANNNHIMYGSWDMERDRQNFFIILDYFLPFHPLTTQKTKIKKMKKNPGDIVILHRCAISDNQMMYGSWDMKPDRQNLLSFFFAIFCSFTPIKPKNQNFEKIKKKILEISFYTSAPKTMTTCYTVPEIWRVTNVIFIFHFGLIFASLPCR